MDRLVVSIDNVVIQCLFSHHFLTIMYHNCQWLLLHSVVVMTGWLADPKDVASLLPKIPHLVYHLNIDYYEHMDFIWGLDSGYVIYPHVIKQILQQH